jgi:D-xylose transport system substrate-binding protein
MKKSTLLYVLALVFSCSLWAEPVKIGILLDDFNAARWEKDSSFLATRIRELGHIPIIRYCDSDTSLQLKQAEELIRLGVKSLIVVAANSEAASSIVKLANKAAVPVIAYDRLIYNSNLDFFVSYDAVKIGEMQAQYVIDKLKGKGRIVILNGPATDANAELFKIGQMNILKPYLDKKNIEIVYSKSISEWTAMEAMMESSNFFATTDLKIDAVIAANDGIAEGVLDAINTFRPNEKIVVTGQDGTYQNCMMIKKGTQSMTVFKPINKLAIKAAELAVELATKRAAVIIPEKKIFNGFKGVNFVELTPIVIDSQNIKEIVFDSGYYQE